MAARGEGAHSFLSIFLVSALTLFFCGCTYGNYFECDAPRSQLIEHALRTNILLIGCVLRIWVLTYVLAGAVCAYTETTFNFNGTTTFTHNSASEYGGKSGHETSKCFGTMFVKEHITVIAYMPLVSPQEKEHLSLLKQIVFAFLFSSKTI